MAQGRTFHTPRKANKSAAQHESYANKGILAGTLILSKQAIIVCLDKIGDSKMISQRPLSYDVLSYEQRLIYMAKRAKAYNANPDFWFKQLELV